MWQESQIQALIAAGINPIDAQATVNFVAESILDGDDTETFLIQPYILAGGQMAEHIQDARIAWYAAADVPAGYKRILDAQEVRE